MKRVVTALMSSDDQGPASNKETNKSNINGLYTVNSSMLITSGTKLFFKSCRDHSQTNVAVVICCTRDIFDSKHFWIYFQSNSAPRAPTHRSRNLVKRTSAPAQPIPAVKTLACPFPGIPFRTTNNPTRSAKSIEYFQNSWSKF